MNARPTSKGKARAPRPNASVAALRFAPMEGAENITPDKIADFASDVAITANIAARFLRMTEEQMEAALRRGEQAPDDGEGGPVLAYLKKAADVMDRMKALSEIFETVEARVYVINERMSIADRRARRASGNRSGAKK